MKKEILVLLLAVCLIFAVTAFAAEKSATSADRIMKADELTGKSVQDSKGADLGTIKSIALDTTSGIGYAVISMDNKLYPIPLKALTKSQDKYKVNAEKSRFAQLPSVTDENMKQELAGRGFDTQVHHFFGIAAPWESGKQTK